MPPCSDRILRGIGELALALWAAYGIVAGARVVAHRRRTGASGFVSGGGRTRITRFAERAHALAIVIGVAAPVLDLAGAIEPLAVLDHHAVHAVGAAVFLLGLAGMALSQSAMGDSWRVGTDPGERTLLVTDGPFALVRNPIYTSLFAAFAGLALVVANVAALASVALWSWAVEVEVRKIEEPHLRELHGLRYQAYAARVGRFVPGIGKIRIRPPGESQFV